MAGRGTDIKLGPGVVWNVECHPHPEKRGEYRYKLTAPDTGEVREVDSDSSSAAALNLAPNRKITGGLHVIGTERHEARRIDRQLRGRCARQGDPGSSHFFISLEDDLMADYLHKGGRLVLFPEGRLTRTGSLMKFFDGIPLSWKEKGGFSPLAKCELIQFSTLTSRFVMTDVVCPLLIGVKQSRNDKRIHLFFICCLFIYINNTK